MRTDSVTLSQLALDNAAKEIISAYGAEYSETRTVTLPSPAPLRRLMKRSDLQNFQRKVLVVTEIRHAFTS